MLVSTARNRAREFFPQIFTTQYTMDPPLKDPGLTGPIQKINLPQQGLIGTPNRDQNRSKSIFPNISCRNPLSLSCQPHDRPGLQLAPSLDQGGPPAILGLQYSHQRIPPGPVGQPKLTPAKGVCTEPQNAGIHGKKSSSRIFSPNFYHPVYPEPSFEGSWTNWTNRKNHPPTAGPHREPVCHQNRSKVDFSLNLGP